MIKEPYEANSAALERGFGCPIAGSKLCNNVIMVDGHRICHALQCIVNIALHRCGIEHCGD